MPLLVDRWLAGDIDVDALLSHRMPLDEVNHAFELMERQDGIRTILEMARLDLERSMAARLAVERYLVGDRAGGHGPC